MVKKLSEKITGLADISQYGHDFEVYSFIYIMCSTACTFASVFLNIFIFRSTGEFEIMYNYNIVMLVSEIISYLLCGKFMGRLGISSCERISLALYMIAYGGMIIIGESAEMYYYIVAGVIGFSGGLNWMAYGAIIQTTTTVENRQGALSFLGMTSNILAIIAPVVSGIIIHFMPGIVGYLTVFAIAALMFLLAIIKSAELSPMRTGERPKIIRTSLDILSERPLRHILYAEFLRNVREGPFLFYMNILLYYFISGELAVGIIVAVKNALAVAAFWFMRKKYFHTHRWLMFAAFCSVEVVLLVIMRIFWLDSISVTLLAFVEIVVTSITNSSGHYAAGELAVYSKENFGCSIYTPNVTRAMFLDPGRILPILILLAIPEDPHIAITAIAVFSFVCLLSSPLYAVSLRIISKANSPASSK